MDQPHHPLALGEDVQEQDGEEEEYSPAAGSLYVCPHPGYFGLEGSCSEFWVCREVSPGLLLAERPFRCPARYRFDPETRLCQRQEKVECRPRLFYSLAASLAVTLREEQLEEFFASSLSFPGSIKNRRQDPEKQMSEGLTQFYQSPSLSPFYPRFSYVIPTYATNGLSLDSSLQSYPGYKPYQPFPTSNSFSPLP